MHRAANPAGIAKYPQITLDLGCAAGGFFRIVREFHGRPAVDRRSLADDRDRVEIDRTVWRASDEIIGQVGAPAEADANAAGKMTVGLFDRSDVHGVGKNQKLLPGIAALLFPPLDDFFAGRDRRRAVRSKAGPVRHPFRRIPQERLGAEGVWQGDQEIAAIGMEPLIENTARGPAQLVIVVRQGRYHHVKFMLLMSASY